MNKNFSAIKRVQIAERNRLHNKYYKSSIKTLIKKTLQDRNEINVIDSKQANILVAQAYSKIDKAVKKGILAKNNAARKKSKLFKQLKFLKTDA
uniref:Ribosomal protein S20 n=1 Tax=Porolithon onkodes TaxID=231751 RepID=A0A2Z2L191_9FLOR|nr:ribosomal protein S20 [Porolithon onkodes]ASB29754.1 ribosomal protein S20 [Porolithon onkodes]